MWRRSVKTRMHHIHTHIWAHILPIKLRNITKNKCRSVSEFWSLEILQPRSFSTSPTSGVFERFWKHPSQNVGFYQEIQVVLTQRVSPYFPTGKKSLASSWATPFRLAASKSSWGISLRLQLKGAEFPWGVKSRHSVCQPKTSRDIYDCFFSGNGEETAREFAAILTQKWRDCSEVFMDRAGMKPSSPLIS